VAAPKSLRILYAAIDQTVPGTLGGSVHVRAVAEGLAARGHEVHALVTRGAGAWPAGSVRWHDIGAPGGRAQLRLLATREVKRVTRAVEPDLVLERYHNFGGEGMLAARAAGARYVLEVNAPVIDYPGSAKSRVDRALVVQPMRRWRDRQVRAADLIVTPSARILPEWVPPERVLEVEWGADTIRFNPDASGDILWRQQPGGMTAVFAGAFRAWHGAARLIEALRLLRARGIDDVQAVLIGDGPERAAVQDASRGLDHVIFTGAVAHERMPSALAAADVGVAPFDVDRHPPLRLGFYWSPLKIFEYMASGLPVVAPALPRLQSIVAHEIEGVLYEPATAVALADALISLRDPDRRRRLGTAARARAEREYSWQAHCAKLDAAFRGLF
jgi:glycosyltransferase involved in cell wall biosynthesis